MAANAIKGLAHMTTFLIFTSLLSQIAASTLQHFQRGDTDMTLNATEIFNDTCNSTGNENLTSIGVEGTQPLSWVSTSYVFRTIYWADQGVFHEQVPRRFQNVISIIGHAFNHMDVRGALFPGSQFVWYEDTDRYELNWMKQVTQWTVAMSWDAVEQFGVSLPEPLSGNKTYPIGALLAPRIPGQPTIDFVMKRVPTNDQHMTRLQVTDDLTMECRYYSNDALPSYYVKRAFDLANQLLPMRADDGAKSSNIVLRGVHLQILGFIRIRSQIMQRALRTLQLDLQGQYQGGYRGANCWVSSDDLREGTVVLGKYDKRDTPVTVEQIESVA